MRTYVDLKHLLLIEEQLQKQISVLQHQCEEIWQLQKRIKNMSYMDNSRNILIKTKEFLNENIRVLTSMALVIKTVHVEYMRIEEKITNYYNLDNVFYPETQFSISRIAGLDGYQSLMPF